ncbi:MAG: hypothetical protein U5J83_11070 [Bryobacterales bacterium]|nr:hypothetical protein [Bryobacterales bacterium]
MLLPPAGFGAGKDCLPVSGMRLLASELARRDPRFAAFAPDTDFGYPPAPGERRMLAAPDGQPICIERASRVLTDDEILAALDLPKGEGVSAQVLEFPHTAFPEGELRFPASGISPPARGADAVLWRGSIEYEPRRTIAIWAQLRLQREAPCLRAQIDVAKGERWPTGKAEAATCDAAAILTSALDREDRLRDRVAVRLIRKGEWLSSALLAEAAIVTARREAMLELRSGGARLVLPVMPEVSGRLGDLVWVRSVATRERLQARVSGPDALILILTRRAPYHPSSSPSQTTISSRRTP